MIYPAVFILVLFVAVILLITTDMLDHTLAALLGGALALAYFSQIWPVWQPYTHPEMPPTFGVDVFAHFFSEWVDLGTIIVILAMMIVTEIIKDSGLFQFIAVKAIKLSRGDPRRLLVILCFISFAMCTVLTQITTILIVGSLTIVTCDALEVNPTPYLVSEAMVANVGGITTMISSVPSMLIAGAAHYDFTWFVVNLLPLGFILLAVTLVIVLQIFRHDFSKPSEERIQDLLSLDEWTMVQNRSVFYRTVILLIVIIAGFILLGSAGLTWLVAFMGALAFFLFSGIRPGRILREVEWSTILFFIGLFLMVGCMEEFHVLESIGLGLRSMTQGNPLLATVAMLWITGITSGAVDNIPVTLTLIPVVDILGSGPQAVPTGPLWAALTIGAVLGGCLTPIASAANVLAMSIAEKEKRPIPFRRFAAAGVVLTLTYLSLGTLYLLLRLLFLPIPPPPA